MYMFVYMYVVCVYVFPFLHRDIKADITGPPSGQIL